MKKILLALLILSISCGSIFAQSLLDKVPADASMVIKYAGENAVKRMTPEKLESYAFLKQDLFKGLGVASVSSIRKSGIDLTRDAYRYITVDDSALNIVTLLRIKNSAQFLQLLQPSLKKNDSAKIEQANGFQILAVSDKTFIGWNSETAVVVESGYTARRNWYNYNTDTTVAIDTVMANEELITDSVILPVPEEKIYRNEAPVKDRKPGKGSKRKAKKGGGSDEHSAMEEKKESPEEPSAPEADRDESAVDREMIIEEMKPDRVADSIENLKRELWEQQEDMRVHKIQRESARRILDSTFTGNIISIQTEPSYQKTIDSAGHLTAWFNYENLLSQYRQFMYGNVYTSVLGQTASFSGTNSSGLRTGMNVYFEKDKIIVNNRSFSPDSTMQVLSREVMNSRQSTALTGYINPGNLGFVSVSINSEATAKYYYTVLKQYLRSSPYMKEYSDITDMYIDFLEIAIDEKALSDLSPGNYLIVLHDMKTKKLDYIDYNYDSEYNQKQVTKTTKELAPDFSFVMETKNPAFMQKLAALPLKYAEKNKFDYKDMGGYYRLSFDSTKNAISNLYFVVKNGRVVVTTSETVVQMSLSNTSFTTDPETNSFTADHNFAAKISTKKLLDLVYSRAPTGSSKKLAALFKDNFADIKAESSYKNGIIQGTTTINITGKHQNSLEFLFNLMQGISDIDTADKKEKTKRAD